MISWQFLIGIVVSYALGCFTTAYYLVRLKTGRDIRLLGSGNVGGRNAGRVLGTSGFVLTFLGDSVKGALAIGIASILGLDSWQTVLAMLAVVIGHIWPVQLKFRGGKGIATAFGAMLIYDVKVLLLIVALFFCLFAGSRFRKLTASGLIAIVLTPVILSVLGGPTVTIVGLSALALLILVAHRDNIRAELAFTGKSLAEEERHEDANDVTPVQDRR